MAKFCSILIKDETLGMPNSDVLNKTKYEIRERQANWDGRNFHLPDDFPKAKLILTEKDFAPDLFGFEGYDFCSRRLRDALAQPESVIQFCPIELLAGGEAVRARDYQMMHILARQPAMDVERSDCSVREAIQQKTRKPIRIVQWVDRYALYDDLVPRTEIFEIDERVGVTLVTDALALRVLHAGCIGVEFRDPTELQHGMRVEHYRTTKGVAGRRLHYLD